MSVSDAIRGPIEALSVGTLELEKLQLVCEVLRRTLRFVSLCRRMEKHVEQVHSASCLQTRETHRGRPGNATLPASRSVLG